MSAQRTEDVTTAAGQVFACAGCGAGLFTIFEVAGHQASSPACRPPRCSSRVHDHDSVTSCPGCAADVHWDRAVGRWQHDDPELPDCPAVARAPMARPCHSLRIAQ